MINVEDVKFYTLLKFFFTDFFCDYLEEAIDDDEKSVVTLFKGMDFFFKLVEECNIDFPYNTIEEYITKTYSDGEEIYKKLSIKYEEEIKYYKGKEKDFEEIYGNLNFM